MNKCRTCVLPSLRNRKIWLQRVPHVKFSSFWMWSFRILYTFKVPIWVRLYILRLFWPQKTYIWVVYEKIKFFISVAREESIQDVSWNPWDNTVNFEKNFTSHVTAKFDGKHAYELSLEVKVMFLGLFEESKKYLILS